VLVLTSLHPTAARTATGNGAVAADLRTYDGDIAVLLDSAAGTGTTPTLDLKIQDSADGFTDWQDVALATFTQVVAVASQQKLNMNKNAVRRYVRCVYTIGGTTPSFTFSLNIVGVPKYPA
jgi:hypothetical protein